jgi:hypothetical protein
MPGKGLSFFHRSAVEQERGDARRSPNHPATAR